MTKTHQGLPLPGYQPQTPEAVARVRIMKLAEERVLRALDELAAIQGAADPRWFAIGRTQIEQGFMAVNRAILKPCRVKLPEDDE